VSQKERNGDQPRVLAGRKAAHTADEYVEVVADVQFFEQGVQQPARAFEATALSASPQRSSKR
jgi:hypothetical protein